MVDGKAKKNREIGSEFHWSKVYLGPRWALPPGGKVFATGRGALLSLGRRAEGRKKTVLHLPTFFCPDLAASLARGFEVKWYNDLPSWPGPDFESIKAIPGELVLAMNYFGIRGGDGWRRWQKRHPGIVVIEDHSHDPFSGWALSSSAGYCLASLRKTLPLPDGAILWSPQGKPLGDPEKPSRSGTSFKLEAMLLKGIYIAGGPVRKKDYRFLQVRGEKDLLKDVGSRASTFTRNLLTLIDWPELRRKRETNIRNLICRLNDNPDLRIKPLFKDWPSDAVPFAVVLICDNLDIRERLLSFLIRHHIYATVHWRQGNCGICPAPGPVKELSERLLTIPLDFRYDESDAGRIYSIIDQFLKNL